MTEAAQHVLNTYLVQNYTVSSTIDPNSQLASATVTAPLSDNLLGAANLFAGKSLSTSFSLQLETNPD
jgi:hypothetical protein